MPAIVRTCAPCGETMHPIRVVDATGVGSDHAGIGHVNLGYAAADAQATWMTQRVPLMGSVFGLICPKCGRIELYGVPQGAFAVEPREPDRPRVEPGDSP